MDRGAKDPWGRRGTPAAAPASLAQKAGDAKGRTSHPWAPRPPTRPSAAPAHLLPVAMVQLGATGRRRAAGVPLTEPGRARDPRQAPALGPRAAHSPSAARLRRAAPRPAAASGPRALRAKPRGQSSEQGRPAATHPFAPRSAVLPPPLPALLSPETMDAATGKRAPSHARGSSPVYLAHDSPHYILVFLSPFLVSTSGLTRASYLRLGTQGSLRPQVVPAGRSKA